MVKVVLSTEARLVRSPDGAVFGRTPPDAYQVWARYLAVFDEVRLLARVADSLPGGTAPATVAVEGPGVRVVAVPDFHGLSGYLRTRSRLRRELAAGLAPGGVLAGSSPDDVRYLAYAPGLLSRELVNVLARHGLDYGLELIGDPAEVAARLLGSWAGPLAGRQFARRCAEAGAVRYVTSRTLQRRYPAAPGAVVASYPSGHLADTDFAVAPRLLAGPPSPATLLTIGSQEQRYKGHDVLLRAVSTLRADGRDVRAVVVGDGRHHEELTTSAARLDLSGAVTFVPALDRDGVNAALDAADLFVLPSLTEGLPRVLVEAMARAVPAVASAVGGVVELLDAADLVRPGDPAELAERIAQVLGSARRLEAMSSRNWRAAERYRGEVTDRHAHDFLRRVAARAPEVPAQPGRAVSSRRSGR